MLRGQWGNQLQVEEARETTKLIAIIDDDDAMQDSLRDLMLWIRRRIPRVRFAPPSRVPDN
jgi:hypothetical protein